MKAILTILAALFCACVFDAQPAPRPTVREIGLYRLSVVYADSLVLRAVYVDAATDSLFPRPGRLVLRSWDAPGTFEALAPGLAGREPWGTDGTCYATASARARGVCLPGSRTP